MRNALIASLAALAVACSAGSPTQPPTAATQPTATVRPTATPAPIRPPEPTAVPSPESTPTPDATSPATVAPVYGWTERADVGAGPSAREDHTWTVDGAGTTAYLFGGRTADGLSNELWAFDLATDSWMLLEPAGEGPAARLGHTATWVPNVGLVVWSGQGSDFFADIWAFDPLMNAWHELPSLGAVPEPRYGSCASLGPDGRLWISHGFTRDDGRFVDTRAYDFATGEWIDLTPTSGEVPVKRCLHDCYWSGTGQLVLYGGQTTGVAALGDIWAYDPTAGAWSPGPVPDAPPRQLYAIAGLDQVTQVVFGGGSLEGGHLDDAWVIDPLSLGLSRLDLVGSPPTARSGATLIHDSARQRMLLFGGQNDGGLLGDLWELPG